MAAPRSRFISVEAGEGLGWEGTPCVGAPPWQVRKHNTSPCKTVLANDSRGGNEPPGRPQGIAKRHPAKKVETEPLVVRSVGAGVELRGVGILVVARGVETIMALQEVSQRTWTPATTRAHPAILSLMPIGRPQGIALVALKLLMGLFLH